jgi:flagellar motor switch protein FliG
MRSTPAKQPYQVSLSSAQKAAIVLASLPRETAAAIVAEVGDAHLKSFVRAVSEMKSVPAQARLAIAQEFIAEVLRRKEELPGGSTEAQRILAEITDAARVERILAEGDGVKRDVVGLWRQAGELPAAKLLSYLQGQRTPVAAAVLLSLPPEKAAEVLAAAPEDFSKVAAAAMTRLQPPDTETADAIATAVAEELLQAQGAAETIAASEPAAAVFDLLPSALRDGLMAHLEAADAPIAAVLRRMLITFEQLQERLNEGAVAALFRSADRETLLKALKFGETTAPETVAYLLANISKRMAEQFREDIAALATPTEQDGESAQRTLIAVLKRLEKSGAIKIAPPK